jgi:hypothetical protein
MFWSALFKMPSPWSSLPGLRCIDGIIAEKDFPKIPTGIQNVEATRFIERPSFSTKGDPTLKKKKSQNSN